MKRLPRSSAGRTLGSGARWTSEMWASENMPARLPGLTKGAALRMSARDLKRAGAERFKGRENRHSWCGPGQAPAAADRRRAQGAARHPRAFADRAPDRCLRGVRSQGVRRRHRLRRASHGRGAGGDRRPARGRDPHRLQPVLCRGRQPGELLDGARRDGRRLRPGERRHAVSRRPGAHAAQGAPMPTPPRRSTARPATTATT
jgi:hypothetical protein